jgi:hypothetical protein
MRKARCILLLLFLSFPFNADQLSAQSAATSLQPGTPIERALSAGQTHGYSVSLEQDQLLQLVVDQRGIDVVVRVFSPAGKRLGEFDSPNGTDGPENVSVIANAAGVYRIDVLPLGQNESPAPGRYEIKSAPPPDAGAIRAKSLRSVEFCAKILRVNLQDKLRRCTSSNSISIVSLMLLI